MISGRSERGFVVGLLFLTAATGAFDAVSYLALDRVFTGNMTGNILFIGFALAGVTGLPVINYVVALAGFVLGSMISGRLIGRGHARGLPRVSVVTLACGAVVFVAIAVLWSVLGHLPYGVGLGVTAALAMVMGAQVSAVKPIGNTDVTTIVVTNTLANLARESRLGGGTGQAWLPRVSAVVCMGLGAVIGAWLNAMGGGATAMFGGLALYTAGAAVLVWAARGGVTRARA